MVSPALFPTLVMLLLMGVVFANDVYPYEFDNWVNHSRSHARRGPPLSASFDVFPTQNWNDSLHVPKSNLVVEHLRYSTASFGQSISANIFRIGNPKGHYTVVEPLGGCQSQSREYTSVTSQHYSCIVATNAGFFDPRPTAPTYGKCLGNVISQGRLVQKVSHNNVAFGMLKNGSFIVGMLTPEIVRRFSTSHSDFVDSFCLSRSVMATSSTLL
eukprot:TRINITY_DN1648_c0_g1_i3.p1 TRINITY_DN1648_c0_g1~~TRINITY_DN1648_c0_g1_i3.p1  ORF type:complete len:214 (-),score=14.10 TRINITY_DN1648_c0_g1_i3:1313-1954(-)